MCLHRRLQCCEWRRSPIDGESDAALWLEVTSGTPRAFGVLFERHRRTVFRSAYRRVGNVTDAEEVVGIVFLEAWRLRSKVRIVDGSLRPWLLSVTANVAFNLRRAQRRYEHALRQMAPEDATEDHAIAVAESLDAQQYALQLRAALRHLPAAERAVVDLCLVEELSLLDASNVLGIPVGTVKSRLFRAKGRLRSELVLARLDSGADSGRQVGRVIADER